MLKPAIFAMGDIARIRQIVAILGRYGLDEFIRRIRLNSAPWFRQSKQAEAKSTQTAYLSTAQRFRLAFEELGPTFVKLGQILATRVDIFNAEWIEEFEQLQSNAQPIAFARIREQIEAQLGQPIEQIFQHIDMLPVGSASIAQVHRAILHDGSVVAVKIKRPDIEHTIHADLRILTHLAQLIESEITESRRYHPVQMVQYFARSLAKETDLSVELRYLQRFSAIYAENSQLLIPKVYNEWSNRQILVQEYIDAPLLKDILLNELDPEESHTLACRITDTLLDMILRQGFFHADPHPGNIFILPNGAVGLIDFGLVGHLSDTRRNEIIALIEALMNRDQFAMQYVLSNWAQGELPNEDLLGADIMEMLLNYEHTTMRNLRISQVINDITRIMRAHELTLPADLVMLFKTLITLEGVVKRLDGDFELLEHAKPIVENVLQQRFAPQKIWRKARSNGRILNRLLDDLPENLMRLNRRIQQGELNVNIDLKRLDHLNQHLDRVANRLTMALVTAALIVGSSIVLSSNAGPKIFGLSLLGFLGYLLAFTNSLWIIWSIWRSGKH